MLIYVLDNASTRGLRDAGFTQPIVALTAYALREEQEKCRAVGFTAHLPTPINIESRITTLSSICNNHNRL